MKRMETVWNCDRCGCKMDANGVGGWHIVEVGEESYIGIRSMYFYNGSGGQKFDLCKKCTLELAKQFVEKMEKEK